MRAVHTGSHLNRVAVILVQFGIQKEGRKTCCHTLHERSSASWSFSAARLGWASVSRLEKRSDLKNNRHRPTQPLLLNQVISSGEIQPVEIYPERGRVLFYDTLCAHSGSANVQTTPRLAFAQKW